MDGENDSNGEGNMGDVVNNEMGDEDSNNRGEGSGGDSEFSMFGGRKNTSTMVQKLTTVKQVDPKQLQE